MTVQHIVEGVGAPASAPPSKGAHYLDTDTGDQYLAKGTASVDDWVLQISAAKAANDFQPKGNYQAAGDYATNVALGNKVDKVAGKGLSTNDFTTEEKNKLAQLEVGGGGLTAGPAAPQPLRVVAIGRRNTAYGSSVSRTIPAEVLPGDLLVAATAVSGGHALTAPAGWTLAGEAIDQPNSNTGCRFHTRVAQAGDAGSVVTWTDPSAGGGNDLAMQLIVLRGAQPPVAVGTAGTYLDAGNTDALPVAPLTASGHLQIALAANVSGYFSRKLIAPAGWTQVSPTVDADSDGFANSFLAVAYKRLTEDESTAGAVFVNTEDTGIADCSSSAVTLLIGPVAV